MTTEKKLKPKITDVTVWNNQLQDYVFAGNLVSLDTGKNAGFIYDSKYIEKKLPTLDPAHLNYHNETHTQEGKCVFFKDRSEGKLPHFFRGLLPGEFGQSIISTYEEKWNSFSEVDRLFIASVAYNDFGFVQLNCSIDANREPLRDLLKLAGLIKALREYQKSGGKNIDGLPDEIPGSIVHHGGAKPKIDFEEVFGDKSVRYLVKLNSSEMFNDAKVGMTTHKLQEYSGIDTCSSHVVSLHTIDEDVLFCENYSMGKKLENGEVHIKRYNRVSFNTLLCEDPYLTNVEPPRYEHIVHIIDKYSADPASDKNEMFRRAMFSASVNHTSNGLDNLELVDIGNDEWRLAPSFQCFPNPYKDHHFDVGFSNLGVSTGNNIQLNEKFLLEMANVFSIDAMDAMEIVVQISNGINQIDRAANLTMLSKEDRSLVEKAIRSQELNELKVEIEANPAYQNHLATKEAERNNDLSAIEVKKPSRSGPDR